MSQETCNNWDEIDDIDDNLECKAESIDDINVNIDDVPLNRIRLE